MKLSQRLSNKTLLYNCWKKLHTGKSLRVREFSRGIDDVSLKDFQEDLNNQIDKLSDEIASNFYHMNGLKGIPKTKEGPLDRLITAPTVRDRVVQLAILSMILPEIYHYINTGVSYCGVTKSIWSKNNSENLNIKKAIRKLIEKVKDGNFFIFKSDINKFFDKVDKKMLLEKIQNYLSDNSLDPIIKELIYFGLGNTNDLVNNKRIILPDKRVGISQGSPLSPLMSNIFLNDFDNYMKSLCGDNFIRYVDDFIIIGDDEKEIKRLATLAGRYLKKLKLSLSDKTDKTYLVDLRKTPLTFLGLRISRFTITSKRSLKQTRKHFIDNVLNLNNIIYRKYKTRESKIECMNQRIRGYANGLRFYHVKDLYEDINVMVRAYKKRGYSNLKGVDLSTLDPSTVPSINEWQSYFK